MKMLNSEEILKLIVNADDTTYLTHNYHPFPCKFIPHIPNLMIRLFSKQGDTILDPFCGSGTSLVEAKPLGRNSIGIDILPIATFLAKVKTTKIPQNELEEDIHSLLYKKGQHLFCKKCGYKTLRGILIE